MSLRTRTSPLPHDCVLRAAWLPTSVLVVAAVAGWDPTHRPEALGGDLAYAERRYALRRRGGFPG
jgi:hypothetical protein